MKAYGDVASSADSPSAAANVWMTLPAVMPSAAAMPAERPPDETAAKNEEGVLARRDDQQDGRGDEQPVVMNAQHGRHCAAPPDAWQTSFSCTSHETKAAGTGSSPNRLAQHRPVHGLITEDARRRLGEFAILEQRHRPR